MMEATKHVDGQDMSGRRIVVVARCWIFCCHHLWQLGFVRGVLVCNQIDVLCLVGCVGLASWSLESNQCRGLFAEGVGLEYAPLALEKDVHGMADCGLVLFHLGRAMVMWSL